MGDVSQYPTFVANQEELFMMFADPHVPDGGGAQKLFKLSKTLSPYLAPTVLSFSGAEHVAQKAVDWLNLKYNSPQLMIPVVYQEVKDIAPARNTSQVPCTAERVLRKVKSLSALMESDNTSLPADIIQAIFQALYLSTEEKKAVLPY